MKRNDTNLQSLVKWPTQYTIKRGMIQTYKAWSNGRLNAQLNGDGESGWEVVKRAAESLNQLQSIGTTAGGAVFAVSHSSFLQTLLAMALDMRLEHAMSDLKQHNGCINVLDVDTTAISKGCRFLGGPTLSLPDTFRLTVPKVRVIRMNEVHHLNVPPLASG